MHCSDMCAQPVSSVSRQALSKRIRPQHDYFRIAARSTQHSGGECLALKDPIAHVHGVAARYLSGSQPLWAGSLRSEGARLASFAAIVTVVVLLPAAPAHASIGSALANTLTGVAPAWLIVMMLAAAPVVELRGAIPLGIAVFQLHPMLVLSLSIAGNMLPVPLILGGLGPLTRTVENWPRVRRPLTWLLRRANAAAANWGENNTFWGLALFVGVPLPGTGAWTGAMASWVLGMPFLDSCAANFAGICIAGILVTVLSCMGWAGFWITVSTLLTLPLATFMIRSLKSDP